MHGSHTVQTLYARSIKTNSSGWHLVVSTARPFLTSLIWPSGSSCTWYQLLLTTRQCSLQTDSHVSQASQIPSSVCPCVSASELGYCYFHYQDLPASTLGYQNTKKASKKLCFQSSLPPLSLASPHVHQVFYICWSTQSSKQHCGLGFLVWFVLLCWPLGNLKSNNLLRFELRQFGISASPVSCLVNSMWSTESHTFPSPFTWQQAAPWMVMGLLTLHCLH